MQAQSLPLTSSWTGPIVVALCAALGPWLVTYAPWTWGVCAVLFVAVGLPHGAVDHITYHHALGQSAKTAPWRFVGPYMAGLVAFAGWLLWMPAPATWAFLALSSWHFGQSHLSGPSNTWVGRFRGCALGAVLIGTLLNAQHASSVEVMLHWMSGVEATHMLDLVAAMLPWALGLWAGAWIWELVRGMSDRSKRDKAIEWLHEGAWLAAMWLLATQSDLLWAFTAYFCLGHAVDSWRMEFTEHQDLTSEFATYYKWSLPFTAAFLAGLLAVLGAVGMGWLNASWAWAVLIAGSVPHMVLLDHWAPVKLSQQTSP
jgi:beta-carotene 15,15'-dioxygenase